MANITIGMIVAYPESYPTPSGWMDCDGANNHLKSEAPALAEFLGTTYGEGYNPTTMFTQPTPPDIDNSNTGLKWIIAKE